MTIHSRLSRMPGLLASLLFLLLALAGCAHYPSAPETRPPAKVPAPSAPPAPPVADRAFQRSFPGFTVVIAQEKDTFSSLAARFLGDPSRGWVIAEFNGITSVTPGQDIVIPLQPFGRGGITLQGYQTVPVLVYHNFSRNRAEPMTVTEAAFEEQMGFLKEQGYHVISMDDLFDFLEFKRPLPRKSVVITIDDGWRPTYEIAFPILKKYRYPATLFIYTDLISNGEKMMTWEMLADMARHGMDIQCHTRSHRNLNKKEQESFREYFDNLKAELSDSARIIRKRLGIEAKYLAYPYGETNSLVVGLLMKLGYRGAFTVKREGNPVFIDNYRLNRSMIYGQHTLKDFERNLVIFDDRALR